MACVLFSLLYGDLDFLNDANIINQAPGSFRTLGSIVKEPEQEVHTLTPFELSRKFGTDVEDGLTGQRAEEQNKNGSQDWRQGPC